MKLSSSLRHIILLFFAALLMASCSTTSGIPAGDQLFVGLSDLTFNSPEKGAQVDMAKEEVEAALATQPNGALFGSSYHRTPFPVGLWVWNKFHDSEGAVGKWINKAFGSEPVLMSWVNPELRAQVAESVLKSHGFFHGQVSHRVVPQKNKKKAKIAYHVDMGDLFTLDNVSYVHFGAQADSLIEATRSEALIHTGDPFDVSTLDAERVRLSNLFRNNGYYYYQPGYASYLADTTAVRGKVQLRLQLADSIPDEAARKWYLGNITMSLRDTYMEVLRDSLRRNHIAVHYNGKRPPLRVGVILSQLKLRPRQLFSYDKLVESNNNVINTGLFSMVDFHFTPRDSSATCDTLDLNLNCVFDKPYDFYVEGNVKGKTSGRFGPEFKVGITKRNAFRGGEKLDINLHGSYEWTTGHSSQGTSDGINSYEYGADASIELPRLLMPFRRRLLRRRFYTTPTTILKASSNIINRARYFKRHVVSGELTYTFQPSETSMHQFSPLVMEYNYMNDHTVAFDSILTANPYLKVSMADQFIPRMRYTYIYTSPKSYRNPIFWQTTVSEASNLLSVAYMIGGEKWSAKDKTMFKNPYAQFFKIESDFRKTWQVTEHNQLVAHVAGGVAWAYGNSTVVPYTEQFYVGGANSIRAFNVRSIGPGSYYPTGKRSSYLDQTGDVKLVANLEYRPRLFGNLYGAVFLDAGNVWSVNKDSGREGSKFQWYNCLKKMALGTGVGVRYDLDFFVIRLDWGVGLHVPYKDGFYNVGRFKDSHSIHLAIGYPF